MVGKYKWLDDEPQPAQAQAQGKYKWLSDSENPDLAKKSQIESFLSGAGDAASFGFGDELLGAVGGVGGLFNGEGYDAARHRITDWSRAQQHAAATDNPWSYGAGQIGGSIAEGFGIGGLGRLGLQGAGMAANAAHLAEGAGPLSRILASAGAGALGGAAYGAGSANDQEDMGAAALSGGVLGGLTGGVLHGLGEVGGHTWRHGIKPAFDADYRAAKAVAESQKRFGQTPQQLEQAMADAPDNAVMMDVVSGGPQLVMGAAARPSAGREAFRGMLDERNNAMPDEAINDLWSSLAGAKNKRINAASEIDRLENLKQAETAPLYRAVDEGFIDKPSKEAMDFVKYHLDGGGDFGGAVRETIKAMERGTPDVGVPGLRAAGIGVDLDTLSHQPVFWRKLLENVQADVKAAAKGAPVGAQGIPKGSAYRGLVADARAFNDSLRTMLGKPFQEAQDIYSARSRAQDAIKLGYEAVNKSGDLNLGKFLRRFQKLKDTETVVGQTKFAPEKEEARRGAIAALEDMINRADTGSGRADVLRSIIGNQSKITTLNHILGQTTKSGGLDQRTKLAKLLLRMDDQRKLFDNSVRSGIGVNSHTADKLLAYESQVARTNPSSGGIKDALWKMVTGRASDQFDESVSNRMLALLQRPVREVETEINNAGGLEKWINRATLLAKAQKLQQQLAGFRQRELPSALLTGLYSNVGFADPVSRAAGL